jgi:hypothetical protein
MLKERQEEVRRISVKADYQDVLFVRWMLDTMSRHEEEVLQVYMPAALEHCLSSIEVRAS